MEAAGRPYAYGPLPAGNIIEDDTIRAGAPRHGLPQHTVSDGRVDSPALLANKLAGVEAGAGFGNHEQPVDRHSLEGGRRAVQLHYTTAHCSCTTNSLLSTSFFVPYVKTI